MKDKKALIYGAMVGVCATLVLIFGICIGVLLIDDQKQESSAGDAKELNIETHNHCDTGKLTVYDRYGYVKYQYGGKIDIRNDGKDGDEIEIVIVQP